MTGSFNCKTKDGKEFKITLSGNSAPWEGNDPSMVEELNDALPAANNPGDEMRFLRGVAHCEAIVVYPTGYPAFRPDWTQKHAVPVEVVPALPTERV